MIDVVILGAGGFAREAYWVFLESNQEAKKWNVLGFIDDNPHSHGANLCEIPILGGFDWLEKNHKPGLQALCAVGSPRTRKLLGEKAASLGIGISSLQVEQCIGQET